MLIGRAKEVALLNEALKDQKSHFIAIYGRRRIGKTFLIRETFADRFAFTHVGLSDGSFQEQLQAFVFSLEKSGYHVPKQPASWLEAFEFLKDALLCSTEKRKVVFIDEMSWMDTPKSRFIVALENFWNSFAEPSKDVVLIVCASATSWMLSNVVHNKGGLYNRLTRQIHLFAFSLKECEDYIRMRNMSLNREQILQYYMIFGGVPYYWGFLEKGFSLPQNVDNILFAKNAPLKEEFAYLYASIFKNPEAYIRIIEALAKKKVGMTREEIIQYSGMANSGDLTERLDELESCGFIRKYFSFGMKRKKAIYQLMDNFSLFYYKFMESKPTDEHFWSNQINTPAVNTWMGLAFERVCMQHVDQMKEKLGISGVLTEVNAWYCTADPDRGIFGSQIDMLIIRKDQVINLCEMKYSGSEYMMTEKTVRSIRNKIHDLQTLTGTKCAIFPTLVTPYGMTDNSYASQIQSLIVMDDLFH